MKPLQQLIFLTLITFCSGAIAADNTRDQIVSAARSLGEKSGYSWTTTTREGDGRSGALGPIDGKTQKGEATWLTFAVSGLPIEVYMHEGKGTAKVFEGWQSFDEVARMGSAPAAVIRYLRAYQTPAAESAALIAKAKDVKSIDDALAGDLPEDSVKEMLLVGARSRDGKEPQASDAKGSIKFWLKDGALTRYEINVQGKVTSGDRESTINRTIKIEIKDVGATKLEVPAEAKQKMI